MPCALIIKTLTDMLFVLLFELFCISLYNFPNDIQFMFRKPEFFANSTRGSSQNLASFLS